MFGKIGELFSKPDLLSIKKHELKEAQFARLQAQTAKEYAESLVDYNDKRIGRLKKEIMHDTEELVSEAPNLNIK